MVDPPSKHSELVKEPTLSSAAVMCRDDGRVLLLQHLDDGSPFAGRWSLPMMSVDGNETSEDALVRVLREHVHVEPGSFDFEDTLYVVSDSGTRFVVNAFICSSWRGKPRFSSKYYADAVWADPAHPSIATGLLPEFRDWLSRTLGDSLYRYTVDELCEHLDETRGALLAAFESIPDEARAENRGDELSAVDVLAHVVDVEAYCLAETDRLLRIPGHTWRDFNNAQWFDLYRLQKHSEDFPALRKRLDACRDRTRSWLTSLEDAQLVLYGNHAERGVVRIGDRIESIAQHERGHTGYLVSLAEAVSKLE